VLLRTKGSFALPGKAGVDQALFVLSGRAALEGTGAARGAKLEPGSAAWIPADARALLTGEATLLQVFVPAGIEEEYASAAGPVAGAQPRWPVVVAAREARTVRRERGALRITPLLHTKRMVHGRFYLGLLEARAGTTLPEHAHAAEAELVYVVAGSARVTLDGTTLELGPGSALHVPAGARHSATVLQELRLVQVFAPAGPEQRHLLQPGKDR
jgi:quercetin dioxygenase-like cupin family protein